MKPYMQNCAFSFIIQLSSDVSFDMIITTPATVVGLIADDEM